MQRSRRRLGPGGRAPTARGRALGRPPRRRRGATGGQCATAGPCGARGRRACHPGDVTGRGHKSPRGLTPQGTEGVAALKLDFKRKVDAVAEHLRRLIVMGELPPGTRLRLEEWARELQVSLTPVREAFKQLEAERLVESEPHRGVRVAALHPDEIRLVFKMRQALETLATREAVPRITTEEIADLEACLAEMQAASTAGDLPRARQANYDFHFILYGACRSDLLEETIKSLIARSPFNLLWSVPGRAQRSIAEHAAILAAVRDRNVRAAVARVREHIAGIASELIPRLGRAAAPEASQPETGTAKRAGAGETG